MRLSARPIWNGRGSSVMSDSLIWTLLGHLVCIAQWAAFILVDYAYLGRGRRFRHPCVWAALLALAVLTLSVLCGFGFFNIKSVVSNIIYLLVIALLRKNVKANWIIIGMMVVAIAGRFIGIL